VRRHCDGTRILWWLHFFGTRSRLHPNRRRMECRLQPRQLRCVHVCWRLPHWCGWKILRPPLMSPVDGSFHPNESSGPASTSHDIRHPILDFNFDFFFFPFLSFFLSHYLVGYCLPVTIASRVPGSVFGPLTSPLRACLILPEWGVFRYLSFGHMLISFYSRRVIWCPKHLSKIDAHVYVPRAW